MTGCLGCRCRGLSDLERRGEKDARCWQASSAPSGVCFEYGTISVLTQWGATLSNKNKRECVWIHSCGTTRGTTRGTTVCMRDW
jgi:hypothetical protein